jgi:diguanylate cyclase
MISQALLIILGGCLLGVVQLTAGIAIGMWLRRSDSSDAHRGRQDMIRASAIARRLKALADEMSSSVGAHRSELNQASQLLTSAEANSDEALAELVVDVIGDMVRANQNLQFKLETAETRLQEQASEIEAHISRSLTDPLTGLPNRREFNERLEERMSAWNRRREPFSLLILDVDHFKKLNDHFGHLAGDQVLAAMGRELRAAIRREDAVARYGGEEFAILLPNTTLEAATRVAQNVREAIARVKVQHNKKLLQVTASGGLATIQANEHAESLIQRADAALYAAKAGGRNCAYLHDGTQCRAVEDLQAAPTKPASSAAALVELINSPDLTTRLANQIEPKEDKEFGAFLTRDEISAELAQTCEELRHFLDERGQQRGKSASASQAVRHHG